MIKARLIKRLEWYYPLEKFHTFFTFPLILIYLLYSQAMKDTLFLLYGLTVCIIILYQGQLYWKLKLQRLKGISFKQENYIAFFQSSKKINLVLLALIPVLLLIQLALQEWKTSKMLAFGIFANTFAVLEYLNYYHTQLMYDNKYDLIFLIRNRKLKKASLAKDLSEKRF